MQALKEADFRAVQAIKNACPHDLARPFIADPKNDAAASFIGKRATVIGKFFEMKVVFRLFELDMLCFAIEFHSLAQIGFVAYNHGDTSLLLWRKRSPTDRGTKSNA